ncbi:MAG: pyruvate kinase [Candidatus Omnitrophota bacterium]
MERLAKTKIIATLGPASSNYTVIRQMVMAGINVARLNFSHGNDLEHQERIDIIRDINKKYRRHIRILQDLEGFRVRVCNFKGAAEKLLKKRDTVWLTTSPDNGDEKVIPFDYRGNLEKIQTGKRIYIDDGNIILEVTGSGKKQIKARVLEGGALKERKGINMPDVRIPFSGITEKDKKDIKFGILNKVDYLAQSFVRRGKDMETVRALIKPFSPETRIVAKIETKEAIRKIDEIIDESDGIMIARGDMGISVPIYEIAVIQKMIIKKCNKKKKFVITATQMLEHMTEHSRPTRAEVTDVANAILDGTDFVMLSGESAAGKYPVESVKMMDKIIKFTETYGKKENIL